MSCGWRQSGIVPNNPGNISVWFFFFCACLYLCYVSKPKVCTCATEWKAKWSRRFHQICFVVCKMNALAPMHAGGTTLTKFKSWWWQNVHWCLYFLQLLSGRQKIECLLWTLCSKCLIEMLLSCITLTPWDSASVHWVTRRQEIYSHVSCLAVEDVVVLNSWMVWRMISCLGYTFHLWCLVFISLLLYSLYIDYVNFLFVMLVSSYACQVDVYNCCKGRNWIIVLY